MSNYIEIDLDENKRKLLEEKLIVLGMNDTSLSFLGDYHKHSHWCIEIIDKTYIISKSRAILESNSNDAPNFLCILRIEGNKVSLNFKLKLFFILGSIFIGIGFTTILVFAIFEKTYFQFVLLLIPFWVYNKLEKEKKEFKNQIYELIESLIGLNLQ